MLGIRIINENLNKLLNPSHLSAQWHSVRFSSVTQSCPTLCPMNRSTPGLPVHHPLLEFTQTHVHRVGDAIQPSHPMSSPSPPSPNPSQHQSLFQWQFFILDGQSIGASISVLPESIQGWFPLGLTGLSPFSPRDSQRVFSFAVIQKH